jgi:hypothetical protein
VPVRLANWAPFVLIFAAVLLFLRLRAQKRRAALTEVARRLGLAFEVSDMAFERANKRRGAAGYLVAQAAN